MTDEVRSGAPREGQTIRAWPVAAVVAALLFLLAALFLHLRPISGSAGARLEGGCAPASSPYLRRDSEPALAAITYCDAGDAATGEIQLEVPAAMLAQNELAVAGYIDGDAVTLHAGATGEAGRVLPPRRPGEAWVALRDLPPIAAGKTLTIQLTDKGYGHAQWAGIGLRNRESHLPVWLAAMFASIGFASLGAATLGSTLRWFTFPTLTRQQTSPATRSHSRRTRAALVALMTLLVLVFRRADQFAAPYLWVEGGTVTLPQFLERGWLSVFDPVAGYLVLTTKLVDLTAWTLSAAYYPEIANALNVLLTAGVLCCIALSSTTLRSPMLCALVALIIPTGSEVFGIPHYAFWWGTLLLLPPLLWRDGPPAQAVWPRVAMTLLGGLSSPLVVALSPLFVLRASRLRNWCEFAVLIAALACACVQMWMLVRSGTHGTHLPSDLPVPDLVAKFFGMFVFGAGFASIDDTTWLVGGILVWTLILGAIGARKSLAWRHCVIAGALLASLAVSIMRVPVESMHPVLAGERYFFYPYILLAWLIIELAPLCSPLFRSILLLAVLAACIQFFGFGRRHHETIDWRAQLRGCAHASKPYALPVHYNGRIEAAWHLDLTPAQCRSLIERSLMDRPLIQGPAAAPANQRQ